MMLYLHIPFCVRKCAYCDFVSYAGQADKMARYVEALLAEMDRRPCAGTVTSVFFGGGTPSLLPPAALARLLAGLRQRYALAPDCEISAEVNPGTVTAEWLAAAAEGAEVGRLAALPVREDIARYKRVPEEKSQEEAARILADLQRQLADAVPKEER